MGDHRITYRGPAPLVGMLRQMLEDEGVAVTLSGEPPLETRGTGEIAESVIATLLATGAVEAIRAVMERFRERSRGRADVDLDENGDAGNADDDD